jgi:hexulose-6-phosphate isomerase
MLQTLDAAKTLVPRRQFIKCLAAGATGSLLIAHRRITGVAQAAPLAGRIQKAFHLVSDYRPIVDRFKMVKDAGFAAVEIRYAPGLKQADVVKARDVTGLPIHGVTNGGRPDLRDAIEEARLYGADTVLLVPGRVSKDISYEENYRKAQTQIRAGLSYAERQQIKILVENVWNNFLLSPMEMARFIDDFQSPWVGSYFDVGNVLRYGWPEQWIRILGRRIGKIHVKDYSVKRMENEGLWKGFDVRLGDGDCDWPAVRKALAEIDYHGWATAELEGTLDQPLPDVAVRVGRVLEL